MAAGFFCLFTTVTICDIVIEKIFNENRFNKDKADLIKPQTR